MGNKKEILSQLHSKIDELMQTGDVILEVNNNTKKDLVYEFFSDDNGDYHLKLHNKDNNPPPPAPNTCVAKDKIFFVMDLSEPITEEEGGTQNET